MRKFLLGGLLAACLMLLMDSCMQFRLSQSEIEDHFASRKQTFTQEQYRVGKRTMHYVQTGNPAGSLVLFVHGSPGSFSDFIQFLSDTTLQQALLISVDRPGFGQSSFGWGEPSLQKQAACIKPILEKYRQHRPITLVGHSLGGPVIARLAIDYPELVDGLIFVAASVDPTLEPPRWWRTPFATPFFRWMLPRSLKASNDEIYPLGPQLSEMQPLWPTLQAKTIVIQGTKDSLVPAANAEFIRRQLTATTPVMIYEEGMDHFVPWSHPHLIKNAVLHMLAMGAEK
jgi:pimeloyl-ACP methyl ester carboxylesterase